MSGEPGTNNLPPQPLGFYLKLVEAVGKVPLLGPKPLARLQKEPAQARGVREPDPGGLSLARIHGATVSYEPVGREVLRDREGACSQSWRARPGREQAAKPAPKKPTGHAFPFRLRGGEVPRTPLGGEIPLTVPGARRLRREPGPESEDHGLLREGEARGFNWQRGGGSTPVVSIRAGPGLHGSRPLRQN